jgi:DNA modification methylase
VETNALYFGDNLNVLSERLQDGTYRFPGESVDLVYLDPPFNSQRDYSLIFKETSGDRAEAQIKAFDDTWHWGPAARDAFHDVTVTGVNDGRIPDGVARMLEALVRGLGHNDMSAYLVMMTPRLVQLHRVLKRSGSLWLHCDPTASHYLKLLLDAIFGPDRFMNEVVWKRSSAHSDTTQGALRLGRTHDSLLFYARGAEPTRNIVNVPFSEEYVESHYSNVEAGTGRRYRKGDLTAAKPGGDTLYEWTAPDGRTVRPYPGRYWAYSRANMEEFERQGRLVYTRTGMPEYKRYLDEMPGQPLQDIWDDIPPINSQAKERLGWATQKPLALLERVIALSSNPGDLVLDPFCGCGTALVAAEKLQRRWIGIDITHLSIAIMRARLMDAFALVDVPMHGLPADLGSARMLAADSKDGRYEFQWWALSLIDAKPVGGVQKKGADRGIDGVIAFTERDSFKRILVSVKSGRPSLLHVKELLATLQTEGGAIGILIELDEPTPEMRRAALESGQYESELWGGSYERVQILTIAELLEGKKPNVPKFLPGYQKAARIQPDIDQQKLFDVG